MPNRTPVPTDPLLPLTLIFFCWRSAVLAHSCFSHLSPSIVHSINKTIKQNAIRGTTNPVANWPLCNSPPTASPLRSSRDPRPAANVGHRTCLFWKAIWTEPQTFVCCSTNAIPPNAARSGTTCPLPARTTPANISKTAAVAPPRRRVNWWKPHETRCVACLTNARRALPLGKEWCVP